MADTETASDTTLDAFYGGRLMLRQARKGHRSGTDAVLLAASVPRDFAGLCCDVGAGVGVAGLGIAMVCPAARVILLEKDPDSARLASSNIVGNALDRRAAVVSCDLLDSAARRAALSEPIDLVVTNPPFHDAARVRGSPDAARRSAHVMADGVTLGDWLAACIALLAPRGTLIVIHAATALPEILSVGGRLTGGVTVMAIHPRANGPAHRVLVRLKKSTRAPFSIAAPLILHEGDRFTDETARVHRAEAGLAW